MAVHLRRRQERAGETPARRAVDRSDVASAVVPSHPGRSLAGVPACRFEIPACPAEDVERLRRELGVSGPLAQVLVRRGWPSPQRARAFLAGREEHPPQAFRGIGEARRR